MTGHLGAILSDQRKNPTVSALTTAEKMNMIISRLNIELREKPRLIRFDIGLYEYISC